MQFGLCLTLTCQTCESDRIEMTPRDTCTPTAAVSVLSVPHASAMMKVPDVYVSCKCQKSVYFKDNCAFFLSMCIRLHFDVSASTYLDDREEGSARGLHLNSDVQTAPQGNAKK